MKKIMNRNKLIGKKYSLSPFIQSDITEEYIGWLNDPEVNRYLCVRHVKQTLETVAKYIDDFYKNSEKYIWGVYSIEDKLIGTVNLVNINHYDNNAALGLMIGNSDYWGKSASNEAISLVLGFAFSTLELNRVTTNCTSTNIGMAFTFKQLGFVREGVTRNGCIENNKYIDNYQWGILSDEWKNG